MILSLDGRIAQSHCTRTCAMKAVVAIFGKYRLPYLLENKSISEEGVEIKKENNPDVV